MCLCVRYIIDGWKSWVFYCVNGGFFSDEVVHPHVPVGDFPFVLLLELCVLLDAGAVAGDDLLDLQLVHQLGDVADLVG